MNEISLFSGGAVSQSQRTIAKRLDSELQLVNARAEVAHGVETARAALTASVINNIGNLSALGEQIVKTTPAAGQYIDIALRTYVVGAMGHLGSFR
jgi:hypothetical protein